MTRALGNLLSISMVALGALAVAFSTTKVAGSDHHAERFKTASPAQLATQDNLLLFRKRTIDVSVTPSIDLSSEALLKSDSGLQGDGKQLCIVKLQGPVTRRSFDALSATGVTIIGYVPNYAYLVHAGHAELARISTLTRAPSIAAKDGGAQSGCVRWVGRLDSDLKVDPVLAEQSVNASPKAAAEVEIEMLDGSDTARHLAAIASLSEVPIRQRRFKNFVVVGAKVSLDALDTIASIDDVLFVGPAPRIRSLDEMSAQITAGNLTPDGRQSSGAGYFAWLQSRGLAFAPDFLIDVADTGLDRGSTSSGLVHPDFLDAAGQSRIAYNVNFAGDGQQSTDDRRGHGTLVASIIGGLGSSDHHDAEGYKYDLGVDPFARIGVSRIFDSLGGTFSRLSFTNLVSSAYARGARLVNNSWGSDGNAYDAAAQEYDGLVRDADPSSGGNQEMVIVFAVGNQGPDGHVNSPGVAKNVITVGASESYRPQGIDSCDLDGQGAIGPDGANNAQDLLRYSSGGPTADGRTKPECVAPGTHIFGAASRSQFFFGTGLCPGVPVYQPPGEDNLFTWSSGTSMAAPHVTGAAALLRRFFTSRSLLPEGRPPSPAMTKAFLVNSASYLTGEFAAGDLPSQRQGWGLIDLNRAFDSHDRLLIDQDQVFTESGQSFEITGSIADRSQPVRITLAWTDAPGTLAAPSLVNDLDLEVKVGGTTVYRGNGFSGAFSVPDTQPDRFNNVESIFLPGSIFSGSQRNFTISVRASNIAGDGVPGNDAPLDQDFALVVFNIAPEILPPPGKNPPVISSVTYAGKNLTIAGHDFTAAARVEINGKLIDREFTFDQSSGSLSIKLKRRKLNLNLDADNQIVVIEQNLRSQPFTLRL